MNTQAEVNGKSPYVKYKKRPFIYSDELNNWTACIKKGDKAGADRHDRAWRKRFAPQSRAIEYGEMSYHFQPLPEGNENGRWT